MEKFEEHRGGARTALASRRNGLAGQPRVWMPRFLKLEPGEGQQGRQGALQDKGMDSNDHRRVCLPHSALQSVAC